MIRTLAMSLCVAGCVPAPGSDQAPIDQLACAEPPVPGYEHALARSGFQPATIPKRLRNATELGYRKVIGDTGVFAVDVFNGSAHAIPNADATSLKLPPLAKSGDEHNDAVRSYFLQAGLAVDQIANVQALPQFEKFGPLQNNRRASQENLVAFFSALARSYHRLPIVDSVAWARINRRKEVVSETVYWPPIPGEVVCDATRLERELADPAALQAFRDRAGVPRDAPGRVVIRHSGFTWRGPFEAFAAYDVDVQATPSGGYTRHFGSDGAERWLPEERHRDHR